jgi:DNA polymerase-3 subunit gamma/tau
VGYQVTARKWRPQTFDDIVEQQHVTRTLRNAIQLGRVAHAYLFAGTRGVGKTTTARVLAKALNCERGPTVDPCNQCQSCREITQGISLDIVEIDGASNRGIDEIRDLRERLRYLPSRGQYKVYIIDEVHMLTKEAFNALLKTLEEPPAHVVFIFATTELEKIPYTILSRCQRFEFKRVSLVGIVEQLDRIVHTEGISISRASLMRIAKAAEGSVRDAQSLFDQVVAFCGLEVRDADVGELLGVVAGEQLAHCLTALCQQDAATALRLVSTWQQEGHETASIVRALLEGLRHVMVLKTADNPEDLIPLSEADLAALRAVAEQASIEEIYGHFHVLSAAESTLRSASNQFMVLEMTLVRMACIGRVQSLQAILDRLQGSRDALPPAAAASGTGTLPPGVTTSPPTAVAAPAEMSAEMPAAPAAASAPEGTASAGQDFWHTLLAWVDKRRPSIAACLQTGRIVSRTDEALVIGFPAQEHFSCSTVQEPENLTLIREAVQAVTNRPLRVTIKLQDQKPERANGSSDSQAPVPAGQPSQEALQQQKRESIQAVLDIFDGRIIM